ncbi:hypothetical protein [Ohtaekwangia koreensis]|jgi:hypothetical protein|uniref:Uncharacterized protein n=1 Tax=Ohtaekwangia koreensis TaxID=688867 RepID=A0A1T5MFY0_9BACT|nr:hypothetical protein [Ohtaekwangia koreensis]SKC87140.1 hypothetical protein SAMN05660236_5341 [Ohtaekwangia koreensis]
MSAILEIPAIHFSKTLPKVLPETKPKVDTDVLSSIAPEFLEDSFVYVHCYFENDSKDMLIRIWRTTYLIDRSSNSRSDLVHVENISFAPLWTLIPDNTTYNFLLIFSALPKSCTHFDLIEEIPQPGGFFVKNIQRNEKDVYHIDI